MLCLLQESPLRPTHYTFEYPGINGASGFPDLISRQAFCGGSLGLRHQYVYELLQGTPLTEVTHPAPILLPRIHLLPV
jgi:hypothetical protein